MNKALWELAAVVFVFTVLCYGAWVVRYWLGDLFFLFMSLIFVLFILLATIELRHWHRKRELEYLRMSHHVSSEIRVVESEEEPVAMIEAPKYNVVPFRDWAASVSGFMDEMPPLPTTEPEPIVLAKKTNVLEADELSVAEKHYKGGANNREKLAEAMRIPNRKARSLIEELKRRKMV